MIHTNFGFFTVSAQQKQGFLHFTNEDGDDFYDLLRGLVQHESAFEHQSVYGAWVTLNEDQTVRNVYADPSALVPAGAYVLGLDMDPDDIEVGMIWDEATTTLLPAPDPEPVVPEVISDRQFFQQLAEQNEITWTEAEDAVGPGVLPASMQALIDQLPPGDDGNDQARARVALRGATTFERSHPLTETIRQLFGWTEAELDEFWIAASVIR